MTLNQGLIAVGYFLFFFACSLAMIWWQRRVQKTRLPFGDDLKLLRTPGETQLKFTIKFQEDLFLWLGVSAGLPALVFSGMLSLTGKLPAATQIVWFVLSVVAFIATFIASARWLAAKSKENANRYLGYFGERIVAEHLEPLKPLGWRIFHDVPGQNNGTKFNVDHVAVGPQGVFAIETKTRRKGSARPGFDDHKVYFDGRSLVWPWGEDNHGLEQAERTSVWLANTLKDELGERVHVQPILTLPGWWVEMKPSRDSRMCRVTNPKGLTKFLPSGSAILSAQQINNIAVKLESRCRDVEY